MGVFNKLSIILLSLFIFNYSVAMEDEETEADYQLESRVTKNMFGKGTKRKLRYFDEVKNDTCAPYDIKRLKFEFLEQLPAELLDIIIDQDLRSFKTNREIGQRLVRLSLVSRLFRDLIKQRKNWQQLLKAVKYVQETDRDEIIRDLLCSAGKNDIEHVRFLILGDADHTRNREGKTALLIAVHKATRVQNIEEITSYKNIVKILLMANANVNICDDQGNTPLILASVDWDGKKGCNEEIVAMLLNANANVNICDKYGRTPLKAAVIFFKAGINIVTMLLNANANIDVQDNSGKTPLMQAVINNNIKAVKLLLKKGANIELKDKSGSTALMKAIRRNDRIVKLLRKNWANLNV